MDKDILKTLLSAYLNKVFGDNFQVKVREKDIYYQVAFQVKKEHAKFFFDRMTTIAGSLWKNLK